MSLLKQKSHAVKKCSPWAAEELLLLKGMRRAPAPSGGVLPTSPQLAFWHRTEDWGRVIYREGYLPFGGNPTL